MTITFFKPAVMLISITQTIKTYEKTTFKSERELGAFYLRHLINLRGPRLRMYALPVIRI